MAEVHPLAKEIALEIIGLYKNAPKNSTFVDVVAGKESTTAIYTLDELTKNAPKLAELIEQASKGKDSPQTNLEWVPFEVYFINNRGLNAGMAGGMSMGRSQLTIDATDIARLVDLGLTPKEMQSIIQHENDHAIALKRNPNLIDELKKLNESDRNIKAQQLEAHADRHAVDEIEVIGQRLRSVKSVMQLGVLDYYSNNTRDLSHPTVRNQIKLMLEEVAGNEVFGNSGEFVLNKAGEIVFNPPKGHDFKLNHNQRPHISQWSEAKMQLIDQAVKDGLPNIDALKVMLREELKFFKEHTEQNRNYSISDSTIKQISAIMSGDAQRINEAVSAEPRLMDAWQAVSAAKTKAIIDGLTGWELQQLTAQVTGTVAAGIIRGEYPKLEIESTAQVAMQH